MKTRPVITILLISAALLGRAGDFAIPWSTLGGGGGTCTSADGRFSVSGTIGQPDAGEMASNDGRFALVGGFWQAEIVFCGCTLGIAVSGGNLVVSWPCELSGCFLEYAEELRDPGTATTWHPVTPPVTGHTYTTPLSGTQRYFRMRAP